MSNEVTIFQDPDAGAVELAPEFRAMIESGMAVGDLGEGVGGNYAILSIRGKTFRVKYQSNETAILDANGDAVPSLEAVIVRANPYLTKQYYENGYVEGDTSSPVCFSIDGKTPSQNAEKPQHTNCATCQMNRFGSRITPAGVKVKACQDNKKVAIVPLADLANADFAGPMLFRIPASALKDLLTFNNLMTSRGYTYNGVAVRIGFDTDASYPKPTFRAMRPLTSDEAAVIIEHYHGDHVERLLGDFSEIHPEPVDKPEGADTAFEQDPQPQPKAKAPPPPPVVKAQPKPAAPAAKAPVQPAAKPTPPPAAKPAAPKAAATPAPPPAAKPKPAAARATPVAAAAPEPSGETVEGEATVISDEGGGLNDEIANILSELNATA